LVLEAVTLELLCVEWV